MLAIQKYINHFIKIWDESPNTLPNFGTTYCPEEQLLRESSFEVFQQKISDVQSPKKVKQISNNPEQSLFPFVKAFLNSVFDFDDQHLEMILDDDFKSTTKDFFYKARQFGPELKPENIYQGIRNAWIMNGIQKLTTMPVKVTPSVFAYSMIYPYSDNFLDSTDKTNTQKQEFSKRLSQRLHGEKTEPNGFTEKQLFKLISYFEEEYSRSDYPMVYESLYAIHKGQTNSLKLINANGLDAKIIQKICFQKGGASVLADGYLVAGKLTKQQEQALFGYGVYLQLLDDIQDLNEDKQNNTKTMFTPLPKNELSSFVNKTVHFGRVILDEMKCFKGPENKAFLALMQYSIEKMIIESVGINHTWYEQKYLTSLEKYSPLRFEYVRQKKANSHSKRFSLFQKYFTSIKAY